MNILYLTNYYMPSTGAAALNSQKIVEYLTKFGHKLMILAPGNMGRSLVLNDPKTVKIDKKIEVKNSNPLIKPPFSWVFSHYENMIRFLIKLKRTFPPDLVLSQYHAFHYASVAASYISKKLKIPHVIRSHDIFLDLKSRPISYRLFNSMTYHRIDKSISKCKEFYVVSTELKDYLLRLKKSEDIRVKVHHNGIDTGLFRPIKDQDGLKEEYGCETIISFIGLITKDIGVQNLIKVLPDILKEHKDTHLNIIGEGSYKNFTLNLINKLKLNKQIHFLNVKPHNEIPFYVNNCDIGIGRITPQKIWTYAVPIKCLEYMACKKPFISTPLSKDIVRNDDVGLILKRKFTMKELKDKIITLIEDKNLRLKLGENGLQKINQDFKWDMIMKKFNNNLINLKS